MTATGTQILLPLAHGYAFLMYLVTWGLLWAQNRREPSNRALRLFLTNMLLWVACEFTLCLPVAAGQEEPLWRATALFWLPSTMYFLLFVYRLVRRPLDPVFAIGAAVAAAAVALYLFTDLGIRGTERHGWLVLDLQGPGFLALSLVPVLPALLAARLLFAAVRASDDARYRRALRLIIVGGLIAMAAGLVTNVLLPGIVLRPGFPHLASLAVVILIPFVQHAIVRLGFLAFDVDDAADDLFEDLRDGVVLLDNEGRARRMNRAARALLAPGPGDDPARVLARLLPPFEPSDGRRECEIAWPAADGERTLLVRSSAALRRGVPLGRLIVIRDLTDRRLAEQVLRRSRNELEEAVIQRTRELRQSQKMEAVGALAAGIAHDLNNLLAAIIGFAGAARDDLPRDHVVRTDLEEVLLAARRARDLVGGLLAFGRKRPAVRRRIDLGRVVREAVRLLAVNLPDRIAVDLRTGETEVPTEADPGQIHQLVMNLTTNALQAIRERGGTITVTVEEARIPDGGPGGERSARLVVADDGPGMAPEIAAQVFEPFFTTCGESGGSGLGLPTVARIVEGHGGRIAVDSAPGRGTVVEVCLPLASRVDQSQRITLPKVTDGRERVLFVDDRERMVRVVRRLLEPLGYRIAAFTRPAEALAAFATAPRDFDLLLTDLAMPGMDGLTLAARVLEIRPGLPVVVMTGNGGDADRVRGAEIGVREIVEKPLDRAALGETLRRILDRPEGGSPA
ncbi:MAG TPA: ATP-binding protein [Polyangia bacterium]|nr:ATP-binding protein [Polyangia bacterium]